MTKAEIIVAIVVAVLGSGGLFTFIQFLINRNDTTKAELLGIKKDLEENKLSACRTELLIMMNHYPNETKEIYRLGQKYFRDLGGDFYMTAMFAKWLQEHDLPRPVWLVEED